MKDQCPVCRRMNCVHDTAFLNAEHYGSGYHKVACRHCGAPLSVGLQRVTVISSIDVDFFESDDWGNPCSIRTDIKTNSHFIEKTFYIGKPEKVAMKEHQYFTKKHAYIIQEKGGMLRYTRDKEGWCSFKTYKQAFSTIIKHFNIKG